MSSSSKVVVEWIFRENCHAPKLFNWVSEVKKNDTAILKVGFCHLKCVLMSCIGHSGLGAVSSMNMIK